MDCKDKETNERFQEVQNPLFELFLSQKMKKSDRIWNVEKWLWYERLGRVRENRKIKVK
jgi:hypothetical protein